MANRNTGTLMDPVVANQSSQSDKSPQMQNGDIQEIDNDNRPSHEYKIYHLHHCRIMNSFNTRTISTENSGNNVPQVTICSSLFSFARFYPHLKSYYQITGLVVMRRAMKIYLRNPMAYLPSLMVCGYFPSPTK